MAIDDHPVAFELAMATAEALASAMPPIALPALTDDPKLAELERTLGPGVRISILRAQLGDWEVRPFDPDRPKRFDDVEPGRGEEPSAAIAALLEQLLD